MPQRPGVIFVSAIVLAQFRLSPQDPFHFAKTIVFRRLKLTDRGSKDQVGAVPLSPQCSIVTLVV